MCLQTNRTKKLWIAAATLSAVLSLAGCKSAEPQHAAGPTLAPADLNLPEDACPATGFVIVEPAGSVGRFPAALAVARLGKTSDNGQAGEWQAESLKEEQAVWWNSLFNTLPAVREVIVMGERTAGPPGSGMARFVASARRLNARICLVYGPMAAGEDEAALIGVLLDTVTGYAIARIQAQATEADFQDPRPDGLSGDKRHVDLQYLVARKFEKQARACVTELVIRDSAPTASQPGP